MKKRRLKKWVKLLLILLVFISLIIAVSECNNTTIFLISHTIAILVLIISILLLNKYNN